MARSTVRLPRQVRAPYEVYLNGVPQRLGVDFSVREGALVFEKDLRKDRISGWRWLLGNRNWLEGGIVALVAGGLVGTLTQLTLNAMK